MIEAFVDTNVCLDLLCGRPPFNSAATKLFSLADEGTLKLHVSSLSFANMDYILKAQNKSIDARKVLTRFKVLVTVLPVDDKIIELSISSDFVDFEDAIQYFTATAHHLKMLITRDLKGYNKAGIEIVNPESFLSRIASFGK